MEENSNDGTPPSRETLPTTRHSTPGQRVALGFLLFFAIGSLGVGFSGMISNIYEPFRVKASANGINDEILQRLEQGTEDIALKGKDTDEDGLNDYDEEFVYKTSPYLKDSDSDGFADKEELDNGHDPNCAKGTSCFNPLGTASSSGLTAGTALPPEALAELEKITPEQIRQILKEKGVAAESLATINDTDLVELYKKSLSQAVAKTPPPQQQQGDAPSQGQSQQMDPRTMDIAQIRKLMLSTGKISKDQLDQVDDATLRTQFLKAYDQAQTEFKQNNPEQ
jgi:hypothetical protein